MSIPTLPAYRGIPARVPQSFSVARSEYFTPQHLAIRVRYWLLLLVSIVSIFFVHPLFAQSPASVVIKTLTASGRNIQFLARHLEILPDTSQNLTFQDVVTDTIGFRPLVRVLRSFNVNAGFSSAAYWLRFRFRDTLDRRWFLTFTPISFTDSIRCYLQTPDGSWSERHSGMAVPVGARDVPWRTPAFAIPFAAGREYTVILRVSGAWIFSNEATLMTDARLQSHIQLEKFIYGLLIGIMVGLVFYNWFVYTRLRDRAYGFYLLHITFFGIYNYILTSLWYYELTPLFAPSITPVRFVLFDKLSTVYMLLFAAEFLHLREELPQAWTAWRTLIALNIAGGAVSVLPEGVARAFANTIFLGNGIITGLSALAVLALAVKTSRSAAQHSAAIGMYFFSAWVLYLLCTIINVLAVNNAFFSNVGGGFNFIAYYGAQVGFSVGLMLFSFALADRFRQIQERLIAEQQANTLLEQEQRIVSERNAELQRLNAELLTANEEIADRKLTIEAAHTELQQINDELLRQQHLLSEQAVETELLNTSLHERNEELYNVNNEKTELLGIVSHDLKTPIAGILGLTEVLTSGEDLSPEHQAEILAMLHATAQRMNTLVKNLLDANAIESGQMPMHLATLDITKLLREGVEFYKERAREKEITLTMRLDHNTSIYAVADEQMTLQIIDNLLSNAVKYSPAGKTVCVGAVQFKSSNAEISRENSLSQLRTLGIKDGELLTKADYAVFVVNDEGPGLSEEDKQKLFGKFARLSAQPTGGEDSTGLGLSIVKKMVEAMHGRIWCESELGKGATFVVALPMVLPATLPGTLPGTRSTLQKA